MVIKIGKLRIDFESRASKHRAYLYDQIMSLREEIIEIVLEGETRNRIPIHELKLKAKLIKKYSRRLKLLSI
tara:strand:+ start:591 stop:806 length:216 start_codon:yes stop_codon:yes gene_type:complete